MNARQLPWAVVVLGWAAALAGVTGAAAETIEERVCLFASAERLPAVPGLVVKSGSVTGIPLATGTREIVGWFPDPVRASEDLNRRFGPLGPDLDLAIRRMVARGESDAAGDKLAAALTGALVGAARVDIGVSAIGRDAVYSFVCVWKSAKVLATAPLGMTRDKTGSGTAGRPSRSPMIQALRLAVFRRRAASRLVELLFATAPRDMWRDFKPVVDHYARIGLRRGWSTRTTAAVIAARQVGTLARSLERSRRERVAGLLKEQTSSRFSEIGWLIELDSGSSNQVGLDAFLLRFNYTNGMIALWLADGRRIDPLCKYLYMAMTAWGLSDLEEAQSDREFERVLLEIRG